MGNDLEANLVVGGLTPAAAKLISNAIDNVATGRTMIGRQMADATPAQSMRLIDSDARRYVFTNLDQPNDSPFRSRIENKAAQYSPKTKPHSYQDSQPASADPKLTTPTVKAGKFVSVTPSTANEVAQSEVTLRLADRKGTHARINQATGEIEAVPILIEVDPKNRLEATVEERPNATVIRLRFLS